MGWRNESHRHYLAAKGISTKRYLSKGAKQRLPDFLRVNNVEDVKRPRLKNAFAVRRAGDDAVPPKTLLELLKQGDRVTVQTSKSKPKEELELTVSAADTWSDLHVGEVQNPNEAYPVGTKIFFRRKNVLRKE